MRKYVFSSFIYLLFTCRMVYAQDTIRFAAIIDSAEGKTQQKKFFPYRTAISTAMVAVGTITVTSTSWKSLNAETMATLGKPADEERIFIDNVLPVVPTAGLYILRLNGVPGEHRISETVIINTIAVVIGNGAVMGAKLLAAEWRPDSSNRLSFPSGHTMNAFVSAELMRRELREASPWYGVAGYTVAITTGYLRMYNRKHWLSDVLAGAGIGILSTQLAYVIYDKFNKHRGDKGKSSKVYIFPYYQQSGAGLYVNVGL